MKPVNKDGLTEEEFLKAYRPKDYPRPSVTADILVFAVDSELDRLKVLLIKRKNHPFINCRALPGGFVGIDEACETAAARELKEETGLDSLYLEQLCTVSEPKRDPRMRVISVAYLALVNINDVKPKAGDDAADADWFDINLFDGKAELTHGDERLYYTYHGEIPQNRAVAISREVVDTQSGLAFDHAELIHTGICRLRSKAEYTPILFGLMPEEFTLPQLQTLHETVLGKKLYKANFRDKIKKYVEPTGKKKTQGGAGRLPELYRYKGVD